MQKKWITGENAYNGHNKRLAHDLNIPLVVANILLDREIATKEEAIKFFKPSLNDLHDPFIMKNMDTAVDRIQEALKNMD